MLCVLVYDERREIFERLCFQRIARLVNARIRFVLFSSLHRSIKSYLAIAWYGEYNTFVNIFKYIAIYLFI